MSAASPLFGEPVAGLVPAAGSPASRAVEEALAIAERWAGPELEALLLGGSHASGEAVWLERDGRAVTVSDLDVYAVVRTPAGCRAAQARARSDQAGLASSLSAVGIEAPLEVGFLTRAGLAHMAARPGTLELALHGRVMRGDPAVTAQIPRWSARDIPPEEIQLLLENRAFELLIARGALESTAELERLRARHAWLKAAADLAGVLALEAGVWPDGLAARLAWARAHVGPEAFAGLPAPWGGTGAAPEALWTSALEWRRGGARALAPAEGLAEWRSAVLAWCALWGRRAPGKPADPWTAALRVARRAPLRRRLRRAFAGEGPPLAERLRHLRAGTPQHRVNASAAVLLFAESAGAPELPPGARSALRTLGVTAAADPEQARRDVVRAWGNWVLGVLGVPGGQRTGARA